MLLRRFYITYKEPKTIGSNTRPWMTWAFGDTMMHADWGGDIQTRKSTISYVFLLNNRAMNWSSCKQPICVLSTTKAEYMAYHKHLKKLFGFIVFWVNWDSNKRKTHSCFKTTKDVYHLLKI
jgi:hypothetical protein